jgi:hypothetical protein
VAIGAILSAKMKIAFVGNACNFLLNRQLLRPDGVKGLFSSVFGEASSLIEVDDLTKMEHAAKILTTVPAKMNPLVSLSHLVEV